MSEGSVNRLADQPWCDAAAILISATATHRFPPASPTNIADVTASAHVSIAVLRDRFTVYPRRIIVEESQPPNTDPKVVAKYTTMIGRPRWERSSLYVLARKPGSQKR